MRIRDEVLKMLNSGKRVETFMAKIQRAFPGYDLYQLKTVVELDEYGYREKVGVIINFFNRDWYDEYDPEGYEYLNPIKSRRITFPVDTVKRFDGLLAKYYGIYCYERN